jgi:hypothetical protein
MTDQSEALWDAHRVAEFLGICYDHFRKTRHDPRYPQPIPNKPGRPRWNPRDWRDFAEGKYAETTQ